MERVHPLGSKDVLNKFHSYQPVRNVGGLERDRCKRECSKSKQHILRFNPLMAESKNTGSCISHTSPLLHTHVFQFLCTQFVAKAFCLKTVCPDDITMISSDLESVLQSHRRQTDKTQWLMPLFSQTA